MRGRCLNAVLTDAVNAANELAGLLRPEPPPRREPAETSLDRLFTEVCGDVLAESAGPEPPAQLVRVRYAGRRPGSREYVFRNDLPGVTLEPGDRVVCSGLRGRESRAVVTAIVDAYTGPPGRLKGITAVVLAEPGYTQPRYAAGQRAAVARVRKRVKP